MFNHLVNLIISFGVIILNISLAEQSFQRGTLKYSYLSVSSLYLTDGKNGIIFDLSITKPELKHWFFNQSFLTDEVLVKKKLKLANVNKVDAIFASHTHFDHVIDVPFAAGYFNAKIYGGDSLESITKAYEKKHQPQLKLSFQKITSDEEWFEIGQFKVKAMKRGHAAIFDWANFHFLDGVIDSAFQFKFYDYKVGENYAFAVTHGDRKFIIDQGGRPFEKIINFFPKLDFAFIGIGNKKSKQAFIDYYLRALNTSKIILLHADFFLLAGLAEVITELPGTNAKEISQIMKEKYQVDVIIPSPYTLETL